MINPGLIGQLLFGRALRESEKFRKWYGAIVVGFAVLVLGTFGVYILVEYIRHPEYFK